MNKNLIYFSILCLLAASCNKEQNVAQPQDEITFAPVTRIQSTKAAATAYPTDKPFGVTAFHRSGEDAYRYFNNLNVSWNGSAWASESKVYWPRANAADGTTLDFLAYAPYNATTPWCVFNEGWNSLQGSYEMTPGETPDLLYSSPACINPSAHNPVNLVFNHALAQLTINFACARFDDSIELDEISVMGQTFTIYNKYTEKNPSVATQEEKSFIFLSGNTPDRYSTTDPDPYDPSVLAKDLVNPIQNIWSIDISSIAITSLAWSGDVEMTRSADGGAWAMPSDGVWTVSGTRQPLTILGEDFYFSPNTKGFGMPFGTNVVIPQDLSPVLTANKPYLELTLEVTLYQANVNAANDGRDGIFDYRDIFQYYTSGNVAVDGDSVKEGAFVSWLCENKSFDFPSLPDFAYGGAKLREDATPSFIEIKNLRLPLYDSNGSNPRYLKMNTNTTYNISLDPAGAAISFSPSIDSWIEHSVTEE